jgi:hypothetical protein
MAKSASSSGGSKSTAKSKNTTSKSATPAQEPEVIQATAHRDEAKTRFNAALDEAKAGAAALKAEAGQVVGTYRDQAKGRSSDLATDARAYGEEAKVKASELAVEGKHKASEALAALSRLVSENATQIDDQFGPKYGDYARNAARSLEENAAKLEAKSIEELGEDTREMVRKSPGTALGIAAIGGYILARLFRR